MISSYPSDAAEDGGAVGDHVGGDVEEGSIVTAILGGVGHVMGPGYGNVTEVSGGLDDAVNWLHPQRFQLRTPFLDPLVYWNLYPVMWPENDREVCLGHLGLEGVMSPETLRLLNDRRSILRIRMFLGRDHLSSVFSGYVSCPVGACNRYGAPDVISLSDLSCALANLVSVWGVYWPGEYGPSNMLRVFHQLRVDRGCVSCLCLAHEGWVNEALFFNGLRAGEGGPPLSFVELGAMMSGAMRRIPGPIVKKSVSFKRRSQACGDELGVNVDCSSGSGLGVGVGDGVGEANVRGVGPKSRRGSKFGGVGEGFRPGVGVPSRTAKVLSRRGICADWYFCLFVF